MQKAEGSTGKNDGKLNEAKFIKFWQWRAFQSLFCAVNGAKLQPFFQFAFIAKWSIRLVCVFCVLSTAIFDFCHISLTSAPPFTHHCPARSPDDQNPSARKKKSERVQADLNGAEYAIKLCFIVCIDDLYRWFMCEQLRDDKSATHIDYRRGFNDKRKFNTSVWWLHSIQRKLITNYHILSLPFLNWILELARSIVFDFTVTYANWGDL